MVSASGRRAQVTRLREGGLSVRRACALIRMARSSLGYASRREAKNAPAVACLKSVAKQYPRYGYRFARIFAGRQGHAMSPGRAYRLWRQEGLQVLRKRPRRRVAASRPRPQAPSAPGHVWAIDFVFDACAAGRQIKCLTVIDEWTRESLAIDVSSSIRGRRVVEVLSRLVSLHGAPKYLRCDNGPEFVSSALLKWVTDEGIETAFIDPGKPWQNGTDESFNGRFRDECLSMEWFRSRREAAILIETWRRHYNEFRPHSSLGYLTPNEFKRKYTEEKRET